METYKDIYEAPAMVYMTGEIAIRIVGSWAYVQTLDGMSIYRTSSGTCTADSSAPISERRIKRRPGAGTPA